jgi:hypothetical protein
MLSMTTSVAEPGPQGSAFGGAEAVKSYGSDGSGSELDIRHATVAVFFTFPSHIYSI